MGVTSPSLKVEHDDSIAGMLWRLIRHILKQRSLSCLWFVSACPRVWAGFLADDEAQQSEAMQSFKQLWETYLHCKGCRIPALVEASTRHSCDTRVAADIARLCRSAKWVVDDRIRARARLIFEGVGQDNFLENAMKACREVEVKQGSSKQHRAVLYWEAVRQSSLFSANGRKDIAPDSTYTSVPDNILDNIFQPRFGNGDLPFDEVLKAKFYSPSPKRQKESWVESELLKFLAQNDMWSSIAGAWDAGLVPEGQLCRILRDDGSHDVFLAVAVTRYGVVGLEAQRVGSSFARVSPSVKRLSFHFAFETSKVYVLPAVAASPLKVFLKDKAPLAKLACMVELVGSPHKLLQWQTEHGFVGVGEDLLTLLGDQLGVPTDTITGVTDESASDPRMSLALACMREVDPSMPENDALSRLRYAMNHDPETEGLKTADKDFDIFDDEVLEDLFDKNDRKDIRDAKQNDRKAVEEVDKKRKVLRTVVAQSFAASPVKQRAKVAAVKKISATEMDRWWATTKGDDRFITKYLPPSARHFTDNVNGRCLLLQHSIGYDRKSFRWTKRGNQQACLMLLQVAWTRHCDATGTGCPLPPVLFENHDL